MAKAATVRPSRPSTKALALTAGDVEKAITRAEGSDTDDIKMIPIDQIRIMPGLQPRLADELGYAEGIEEIVASIVKQGFLRDKPLSVFASVDEDMNDVIYVLDGHGRLEAARIAVTREVEIESLPCVFVAMEDGPWFDAGAAMRNMTQRTLSPLSQAVHVRRLIDAKKTHQEAADMLSITRRYAYDLDLLSRAPKAVIDAVKNGDLSAKKAVALVKKHEGDRDAAAAAAQEIAEQKANRVLAREQAAADKANGVAPAPKPKRMRRTFEVTGDAGDQIPREEAERFSAFLGEEVADWWVPARAKSKAKITRYVKFRMSIVYDAPETEPANDAEADDGGLPDAPAPAPAPGKGRGRARKADAPDITGIADPA